MGSLARVEVYSNLSLEDLLMKINQKNIISYGACLSGTNMYELKKDEQCAIVFGSESHGINTKIKKLLDQQILIPSKGQCIDSLNVSVAFGIILSEFR